MKRVFGSIFIILLLSSCEENKLETDDNLETNAIDVLNEFVLINQIFQDVGNNGADAVLNAETSTTGKFKQTKDAPVITVEPFDFITFPKTTTVDFGSGVLCKDGITRKGIITIVSTNWYREAGSTHTTTFNDYYHESFKVEGTHVVENAGVNQDSQLEYNVIISNGKVIDSNGGSVNYTENSTRTWVAGSNTPLNIWDDEYLLDGVQTGQSSQGVNYTFTVEEPLHFVLLPRHIKSGILDVEIGDLSGVKLNYTNSTFTIFGKEYPLN